MMASLSMNLGKGLIDTYHLNNIIYSNFCLKNNNKKIKNKNIHGSLLFTTTLKIGYFLSWCKQSWQNNDLGYSAWVPGKLALNGLPWRCLWSEPWKIKCPWKQKVTRKGESKVINKNPIQYLQSSMNVVLNTSSNVT